MTAYQHVHLIEYIPHVDNLTTMAWDYLELEKGYSRESGVIPTRFDAMCAVEFAILQKFRQLSRKQIEIFDLKYDDDETSDYDNQLSISVILCVTLLVALSLSLIARHLSLWTWIHNNSGGYSVWTTIYKELSTTYGPLVVVFRPEVSE